MINVTNVELAFYNCTNDVRRKISKKINHKLTEKLLQEGAFSVDTAKATVGYPYVSVQVTGVTADSAEQLQSFTKAIIQSAIEAANVRDRVVKFRELQLTLDKDGEEVQKVIGRRTYKAMNNA